MRSVEAWKYAMMSEKLLTLFGEHSGWLAQPPGTVGLHVSEPLRQNA